jgi:Family of unknown function (DUF5681)
MKNPEAPASDPGGEAPKPPGRPFEPGQSGNPNGRPKGSRNKATVLAEQLLDGEAEGLLHKLIEKALAGDSAALRLCLDRLLPPRRDRLVTFTLPKIETAKDACAAAAAVLAACANGELSTAQAAEFIGLIETHARMLEKAELETRLAALEAAAEKTAKATSSWAPADAWHGWNGSSGSGRRASRTFHAPTSSSRPSSDGPSSTRIVACRNCCRAITGMP